ncbi:prostaglandin e2 receptor ep4 subtype [Plakobranchus ocellatus]|uniref:Prostaglandin e2 receptor ep4 subtype n=1 Tax=Plakobranchus ocellatus TaxID=259542 RepID=A0AAV3ZVP0_9GAST|nr:prostaglandin e2 receptor ep4 subtype [Plakobranchus ocellatus]
MASSTQAIISPGGSSISSDIPGFISINSSFLPQGTEAQQQQYQDYSISLVYNVTQGYITSSSPDIDRNSTTSADNVSKNVMVPSLMFLFGVFGNILALIILTVKPSKDSKSTAFYHLVKALVCMDLFGIVATSPVTIIVYLNDGIMKTGGTALCHYFSFLLMLAGNATVFTVLVMAGERFMVSKYPFQYSRFVRPMVVNLTVGLVWGYSTLIALLPVLGVGQNKSHWPYTWCFFDYRSTDIGGQILSYFYAISGLLAILITIALNLTVIRHLWSMRKNRLRATFRSSSKSFPGQEGNSGGSGPDSELRMVVFLMAIIIVFTVCYAPLMIALMEH